MFQITPLSKSRFEHLFALCDEALAVHGVIRRVATARPGFPCRVSLEDAEPGEEVLLLNFEHHDANSPFRASHAIYVRPGAGQARLAENEVPELFRSRVLSLRAFDRAGMMVGAELADGTEAERAIGKLFELPAAEYLHAHFAAAGCYAARIDRGATAGGADGSRGTAPENAA